MYILGTLLLFVWNHVNLNSYKLFFCYIRMEGCLGYIHMLLSVFDVFYQVFHLLTQDLFFHGPYLRGDSAKFFDVDQCGNVFF